MKLSSLSAVTALAITCRVLVSPALAQASQDRESVSFTLSQAGGCQALPAGLVITGNGEAFTTSTFSTNKNGALHANVNTTIHGTATDTNGGSYVFNYHNHSGYDAPASGFPFTIRITDSFNLVGGGAANQLHTHFVLFVTFADPTSPPTVNLVNVHGDPDFCDPI